MNVQGILKSDDIITRFFRLSTQMMVELCYRQIPDQTQSPSTVRAKLFHTIDAYVKLIVLLVKHSGDANAITTKTNLLNKVWCFISKVLTCYTYVIHLIGSRYCCWCLTSRS